MYKYPVQTNSYMVKFYLSKQNNWSHIKYKPDLSSGQPIKDNS